MALINNEQIFIQIGDEVIELQGAELEAFLIERDKIQAKEELRQAEQENKIAQKAAILERIGLTEEELQIVLGA